jgi:dipeptidyl aminopeptidase/acylaminoacyl peptidase
LIKFEIAINSCSNLIISEMKTCFKNLLATFLLPFFVISITAQTSLSVIKPEDYAKWQNLGSSSISDDGSWVSWNVSLIDGDDTLYIKNANSGKMYKFPLSSGLSFSSDSKWAAFKMNFNEKTLEKMREEKKPIKYKCKLLDLVSGKERIFENTESYSFTKNANHLIMNGYSSENSKTKDIFIYNLKTGTMKNIGNISEYSVNKPGNRLAYIINAEDKKGNGVELMNLDNYNIDFLDNDTSIYRNLVWEREGDALAFLKTVTDTGYVEDNHILFTVRKVLTKPEVKSCNPGTYTSFPDGLRVHDYFKPVISKDHKIVFFGAFDWTVKEKKDKNAKEEEKLPGVDIWHWKDDPVQPRQKVQYNTDKNFSYLFAWNIDENTVVRITDENMRRATPSGDGHHALATDDTPYQPAFRQQYYDHYVVNTSTGEKKLIMSNFIRLYGSSPAGKYALYFKDKDWWVYDIYGDKHVNLTEGIESVFWNTRDDSPKDVKPPFGNGGWFKDDKAILIYDEYDVWKISPDSIKPVRLTNGKENKIIFRVTRIDTEYPYIDPAKDLYFTAFGDIDKRMGYSRLTVEDKFEKLIFEDKAISGLRKAKESDYLIYRAETYSDSPDIFRVPLSFTGAQQISETNPQQAKFAWGKSEIIHFKNRDGKPLQAALFYPANYEPGKKYPMIVYIYEIRSNVVHRYVSPSPRNAYNTTNYTSQGYFVYQPDIVYKTNQPGESAANCVIPAMEEILKTGMIDEKKIGIMGHSWGAYQTSFIITQTKLFSAAVAGAPLINMISMYNEIYWNSGSPNQSIFETSQGRLREPWWVIMDDYMRNSPMFQAQNIVTPLLVAFGNEDGAVDWHQGIEMFTTMRRMEKPYIMLVYDSENHSLSKKENQIDYTKKVNEFFNHYLLGQEAEEWLIKGKKYVDKKIEEEKVAAKK